MSELISEYEVSEGYKKVRVGPDSHIIPEDWTVERLEPYVRIETGSTFSSEQFNENGEGVPLIRIRNLPEGETSTYYSGEFDEKFLTEPEAILVGMDGEFHTVRWRGETGVLNQRVARIEADHSDLNEDFLYYRLIDEIKAVEERTPATTVKHLSQKNVNDIHTVLPPIREQRRIADVLSTADNLIQYTGEIIDKSRELKEGLIQDLVFYGPDHDDTQTVQLGPMSTEIAESWDVTSIEDVTTTVQYGSSESLSQEGEYPMFRMNNIEDGRMVASPMKYTDLSPEEAEKYRVEKGDILFNRTNSIELVGKSGIFDLDGEFVFASYLIRVQTNEQMNPYFLNHYLNSQVGQGILKSYATRGASQANINATSLKSVKAPLPPRDVQDKIVEQIQTIEKKIDQEQEMKEGLQDLKRGLMQDLLTGKSRVKPDSE
jgi:type I restriction enzyme S subunit